MRKELSAARHMIDFLRRSLADLRPAPLRTLDALEECAEAIERDMGADDARNGVGGRTDH